jgi:ABC-type multidrug transport system fused ATPase/permease subunit
MHELKRYFSYMGKHQFTYWMILITTIVTENVLNILYSYVNKQTLNAIEYSDMRLFRSAVILCVIVLILRCLFPYLRYFSIHLVRQMFFEVKSTLFDKLLTLNMSWYESNHSGDGIKALNWDANSLKDSWFSHVYWILGKVTIGISSLITMFIYCPLLAGISVVVCLMTATVTIYLNNSMKKSSKKVQEATVNLAKWLNDILAGFSILKMYSGSNIVIDKYLNENQNVTSKELERTRKASFLEMLNFLLGLLGSFSTILFGVYLVSKNMIDYGTIMAVVTLQISLSATMQRLGGAVTTFNNSLVKASRVFDFMDIGDVEDIMCSDIEDNCGVLNMTDSNARDNCSAQAGGCTIDIKNLTFSYNSHKNALTNFNLNIGCNEKIMLKGKSGCGKSTLLKLLLRFYDYQNGHIKINNIDLKDYPVSKLRNMIAYIPQDCFLFEGTIAENIAYGLGAEALHIYNSINDDNIGDNIFNDINNRHNNFNKKINYPISFNNINSTLNTFNNNDVVTLSDIISAAKLAYADEFISQLPDGYETHINSGGTNLSGGQRQRIAIARAFLKNAPILLMDEPSSALDEGSEKMINKALHKLMHNKLVIMVSHRDSGDEEFDRVVWM